MPALNSTVFDMKLNNAQPVSLLQSAATGSLWTNGIGLGQITNCQLAYRNSPYTVHVTPSSSAEYPFTYNYVTAGTSAVMNMHYYYQYIINPNYQTLYYRIDLAGSNSISCSTYVVNETPEQREQREAVDLQRRIKHESANKRAEELLLMLLNDDQKQQYAELNYFETAINDRVYRIRKGRSGNVRMLKDGKEREQFCAHPVDYLPDADTMIAQYLMLKTDEQAFLAKANRTVLY